MKSIKYIWIISNENKKILDGGGVKQVEMLYRKQSKKNEINECDLN